MLEEYKDKENSFYTEICRSILNRRLSHAYLLEASSLLYGKNIAFALAKAFLCCDLMEGSSKDLAEKICKDIDCGQCVDFRLIIPNGQWIKKEQILELQTEFKMKSVNNQHRVYIILGAELLNKSAANCLLKFLEEPEDGIIAILVSENIYQILPTIVSRCQIYRMTDTITIPLEQNFLMTGLAFFQAIEEEGAEVIASMNLYISACDKEQARNLIYIGKELYGQALQTKLGIRSIENQNFVSMIEIINTANEIDVIIKKLKILIQVETELDYNVNMRLWFDRFIILLSEVKKCIE